MKLSEQLQQRIQSSQEELVERITQILPGDGSAQPLPGIFIARLSTPQERLHSVLEPSFCVIAQGSKETFLGQVRYQYDPLHYLLTTMKLPRVSQVMEASKEQPYLSFRMELDPALVSSVMIESGHVPYAEKEDARAVGVSMLDADLLDAVVRLIRLSESPDEIPVLRPLIEREIIYRLLVGEQGTRLRYLATVEGYAPDIAKAVERIRDDFDQPLSIDQLASDLGMSVSGFHHHFKAVTALSPLQYQKQLRLQEARRLMLGEDMDAASAAYQVGYNDASHFSREYKRLFGEPPMRHVQQLRETVS